MAAVMILLSLTFVLAACAPYGASAQGLNGNPPAAPSATPMTPVATSGDIQVANNSKLGQILVTSSGFTLYTFERDKPEVSTCTDATCVTYWPPYTASAQPMASTQLPGKLGLITRTDGKMQVTYNELPLYTFIGDKKPGDATGDGLNENGGIWHAIMVSGASSAGSSGNAGSAGSSSGYGGGYSGGYK